MWHELGMPHWFIYTNLVVVLVFSCSSYCGIISPYGGKGKGCTHSSIVLHAHLLYGRVVNVIQATHRQHMWVATASWVKRSGTSHTPQWALELHRCNSVGLVMDVPSSTALYICGIPYVQLHNMQGLTWPESHWIYCRLCWHLPHGVERNCRNPCHMVRVALWGWTWNGLQIRHTLSLLGVCRF